MPVCAASTLNVLVLRLTPVPATKDVADIGILESVLLDALIVLLVNVSVDTSDTKVELAPAGSKSSLVTAAE